MKKHLLPSLLTATALIPSLHAQNVTWTGSDFTWDQPDTNSFNATYNSGDNVLFTSTGVGNITVGSGVTPGNINFTHSSGTYLFSGTAWNAGTNSLTINGTGTVQFGNMASITFTPTWGSTTITGGGVLNYTRGTNIGSSGATITLNNGALRLGTDNSSTFSYDNPFAVSAGGGSIAGVYTNNNSRFSLNGSISGSGALSLTQQNTSNLNLLGGLILSGNNSGLTGPVTLGAINTSTNWGTYVGVGYAGMTRFANSDALFSGAPSVTVQDGGIAGFNFAVTDANLANISAGLRGGVGAYGSGVFTGLSANVLDFVGKGGMLYLENFDTNNNDRISDSAAFAMDSTYLNIRGRNAASTPTNETIGAVTVAGSSRISLVRSNSSGSGVKLTMASLDAPAPGVSLFVDGGGFYGTGTNDSHIIVTGSKPTVTNGMVSPGIQLWVGGTSNLLGDFMTFSGNDLVSASGSYTDYSGDWASANSTQIVNVTAASTLTGSGDLDVYALRLGGGGVTHNLGNRTINIGSGGIISDRSNIQNGTLNFGSAHGYMGVYDGSQQKNITATIAGSNGLTIFGVSQSVNIQANNTFTGGLYINGATVDLQRVNAANANDVTINAFGRLTTDRFTAAEGNGSIIGGLSGEGRLAARFQGNSATAGRFIITPAGNTTHTFNGLLGNGDAGRVLHIRKEGAGRQIFGVDSLAAYTGATEVNAGTLLIHGDFSGATGAYSVASGAVFGGNGTIGGALTLAAGALFAFDPNWTLTATPTVSIDSSFGVASLRDATGAAINWSLIADGTYTLINSSADFSGISNFGIANAYDIGGGRQAYFQNGSLQLVVIPEPSTWALLAAGLTTLVVFRRRRLT